MVSEGLVMEGMSIIKINGGKIDNFPRKMVEKYDFRTQKDRNLEDEDGRGTGNRQPLKKNEAFPADFSRLLQKKAKRGTGNR